MWRIGLAVVLALGLVLVSLASDGQQATKLARIGLLSVTTPAVVAPQIEAFKKVHSDDLPVERPSKFELVLNLRTAHALGPTLSRSLLQRADQLIQ